MAEAKCVVSSDQFICSVCLEVLKNPATIPCGHNYCMRCIKSYWDDSHFYSCPQCRMRFSKRPLLHRNVTLSVIIDSLHETKRVSHPPQSYAEDRDVPCDVCAGRKLRAAQSCLTCLVSFCDAHIRPHREAEAFRRHKLVSPIVNLHERICPEHNTPVDLFCLTDDKYVCFKCVTTEHKDHETVAAEKARAEKQSQAELTLKEFKKKILKKEKKVMEIKKKVQQLKGSSMREKQGYKEIFTSLLRSIESLQSEVTELIRSHEQKEILNADVQIEQLEKETEELKRREAELVELSQTDDHIHFLQEFPSVCALPKERDSHNICINIDLFSETLKNDMPILKKHLKDINEFLLLKIHKIRAQTSENINEQDMYSFREPHCEPVYSSATSPGPGENPINRYELLKYTCQLTLDPKTAHRCLTLSEGNKKATWGAGTQSPNCQERFDCWPQVLCKEALSGSRCYWEVEWSGRRATIGVAYKGIARKGEGDECVLGCNNKSWSIRICSSTYSVCHNNTVTEIAAQSSRVGVYLDYQAGFLSFYALADRITHLHTINHKFTEPLYPGFAIAESVNIIA
ncbi:tripartite motif-containing protein 16-like [Polypterus senegalus]|uniref:tripartite motif-containing protein 16-like n=1 Tax=Polypterus senegalus TaxID=55291 RepID=UPI001965FD9A|nr:tripartite motif-containing protein 16-like [Polypterus senegalus]